MDTDTKTPEQQHAQQVAMLQVFTTEQKAGKGEAVIIARTRSTEKNPVIEANRLRCIVVPELEVTGLPSKYQSYVVAALYNTLQAQLDSLWKANPAIKEVQASIWNADSALMFAAREQESKRLTSDNLAAWFAASDLATRLTAKQDDKLMTEWLERIQKFAAPTVNLSLSAFEAVISAVGKADADEDNLIGRQIVAKATKRAEEMRAALQESVDAI